MSKAEHTIVFSALCAELAAAWQEYRDGAPGGKVYPIMQEVARAYLKASAAHGVMPAVAVRDWRLYHSLAAHGVDWLAAYLTQIAAEGIAEAEKSDF